jgi:hypothetical protein
LIKVHTTKDQAQAIPIPGQADTALAKFEEAFFNELCDQHDRVDLFVNSKADEISRRLGTLLIIITSPSMLMPAQIFFRKPSRDCSLNVCTTMGSQSPRRGGRSLPDTIEKLPGQLHCGIQLRRTLTFCRCGDEIRALQRFVDAQRTAFHKILKKYKVRRGIRETCMYRPGH